MRGDDSSLELLTCSLVLSIILCDTFIVLLDDCLPHPLLLVLLYDFDDCLLACIDWSASSRMGDLANGLNISDTSVMDSWSSLTLSALAKLLCLTEEVLPYSSFLGQQAK